MSATCLSLEVERDVPQNLIMMAFHIPSCLDAAYPAYDIVTDFLASGKSSRLNRLVRESGKFVSADSYVDEKGESIFKVFPDIYWDKMVG